MAAVAQFQAQASSVIQVTWKPFMIDPSTHVQGEDMQAYCQRRWGGSGWTRQCKQAIPSGFANWKWWPHTLKAHQLIHYVVNEKEWTTSNEMNAVLFQAEYEEGCNLSNVETLCQIAQKVMPAQLDKQQCVSELQEYLEANQGKEAVLAEIQQGRQRYRISGVPFFIIDSPAVDRPYGFSGAQATETFLEIFQELCPE